MKIGHLNIRSLLPKIHNIREHIANLNFDILAISETWLTNNIENDIISIEGYTVIRRDRPRRAGGVCIYIRKKYKYNIIYSDPEIEQLWISLNNIAIGVLYRPEYTNYKYFLNQLEISVDNALSSCEKIIFVGDLNIDMNKINDPKTVALNSVINSLDMKQIVHNPTRVTLTSATLIDLIVISSNCQLISTDLIDVTFSDHDLAYAELEEISAISSPRLISYRDFSNFSYEELCTELNSTNLSDLYYLNDVNDKINLLNDCLLHAFDLLAPVKTKVVRKMKPEWLTENLKFLISLKNKAKVKFRKTKNSSDWDYYKDLRNYTNLMIKHEKKAYIEWKLNKSEPGKMWKELKNLNIISEKSSKAIIDVSELGNASDINKYFIESIPSLQADFSNLITEYNSTYKCNFKELFKIKLVKIEDVDRAFNKIKTNAEGCDGLNHKLLKLCWPYILSFVTNIINSCFLDSTFPIIWKKALVLPLPKVKNPAGIHQLRPISILPTLSKIFERIIHTQIMDHLKTYSILPKLQSGFREGYSCNTALLKVTDDILESSDSGKITALVLLDYTKAFDTLNHNLLIAILKYIGFDQSAITLMRNYLEGRFQAVKLGSSSSDFLAISSGVPQGSILGPLLYSIYSASIPSKITYCNHHMYADDTQLYISFFPEQYNDALIKLNEDLNNVYNYSISHSLLLNPSKSACLLFGPKVKCVEITPHFQVSVNNEQIPIESSGKNLGVLMDNTFRYRGFVSKCISNAFSNLRRIYLNREYLSRDVKILLMETTVLSQFNFCSSLIHSCLDENSKLRIQRVQNSCIRLIYGLRRRDRVSHKLKDLQWLNMDNRRKLQSYCLYHNIIKQKTPVYLFEKLCYRSDVHNINIRSKGRLSPPKHKTSLYERSFHFTIVKLLNMLPEDIINIDSKTSFRKRIFKMLFSNQFDR